MNNFAIITFLIPLCTSVNINDWQPVLPYDHYQGSKSPFSAQASFTSQVAQRYYHPNAAQDTGECELYKVGFSQDLYFQYIQYKTALPELKEFTLCMWSKFYNHSNYHPLFSYAVESQPRAIYSWISNTDRSSYYSLAVAGHTFYRLNYPLRLNRWYHTCQSWNSRTGEWQIWVNAERVGRGFHNRLVGSSIPSGGIAITGQEQTQYGGGFSEGADAPQGSGGMLGEITMAQLYNVALTAGKAHKDHKHHHVHQVDHNGAPVTTTPSPPSSKPTLPTHPLLTAGQINPNLALNIVGQNQAQPQIIQGQNFNAQLLNGQFVSNLVSQQLLNSAQQAGPQQYQQQQMQPQQLQTLSTGQSQSSFDQQNIPLINSGLVHPSLVNPANVQIIDTPIETHQLFKRQNIEGKEVEGEQDYENPGEKIELKEGKQQKKRELFLAGGTIIDESLLKNAFDQSLLDGLAGIGQNEPIIQKQKQSEEREPAEAEVTAVMNVCSGCNDEPFEKALVFGWRTVPKKLYSGAFYQPALPECKYF